MGIFGKNKQRTNRNINQYKLKTNGTETIKSYSANKRKRISGC